MTKPTEYTLDVSKWRCGTIGEYRHGLGRTLLLNKEGFMCCLGQFAEQVGVDRSKLLYQSHPSRLGPYDENFIKESGYATKLAAELIDINDNPDTTPMEKIALITSKLAEDDIKLNIIDPTNILNLPI